MIDGVASQQFSWFWFAAPIPHVSGCLSVLGTKDTSEVGLIHEAMVDGDVQHAGMVPRGIGERMVACFESASSNPARHGGPGLAEGGLEGPR